MPENAQEEIAGARTALTGYQEAQVELQRVDMALRAKCMALQQAGIIPLQSDPAWLQVTLEAVDVDSLRLKALMKGENPRN